MAADATPPDYVFLRLDRANGRNVGGGGIMCRKEFNSGLMKTNAFPSFEHCIIERKNPSHILRIIILYRPPLTSSSYFNRNLIALFEDTCLGGTPGLTVGDFNVHYDKEGDLLSMKLLQLLG